MAEILRIHPVTHREPLVKGARSQLYCGPGAISALTGRTAECGAAWINARRGYPLHYMVKSASPSEVRSALESLGYFAHDIPLRDTVEGMRAIPYFIRPPTMEEWLARRTEVAWKTVFLVLTTTHYVAVQGAYVCDNLQGLVTRTETKHGRKRVRLVWAIGEIPGAAPVLRKRTDPLPKSYRPSLVRSGQGNEIRIAADDD